MHAWFVITDLLLVLVDVLGDAAQDVLNNTVLPLLGG